MLGFCWTISLCILFIYLFTGIDGYGRYDKENGISDVRMDIQLKKERISYRNDMEKVGDSEDEINQLIRNKI